MVTVEWERVIRIAGAVGRFLRLRVMRSSSFPAAVLPALFLSVSSVTPGAHVCPGAVAAAIPTTATAVGIGPGPPSGGAVSAKRGQTLPTSLSPRSKRRARSAAL